MHRFFSKSSAVLAGAVIVAGTFVLPLTTIAQSPPPLVSDPTVPDSPGLTVIQGQITNIEGNLLIVKTPDVPPYCPPGRACPAIIVVGPTFTVDIASATFQSASGRRLRSKPRLKVNDSIVVAGRLVASLPVVLPSPGVAPQFLKAEIVSKAIPNLVPVPTPVP